MSLTPEAYSRFLLTPPTVIDGKETFGVWVEPGFMARELQPDEIVTVTVPSKYEGRPDRIAFEVYGTTRLDWVIMAYNAPRSTLNWPRAGDVIRYPIRRVVVPELS